MTTAIKIFDALLDNGLKAIELLQKRAFTPNQQKTLRTWGITDACKMIGRSVQTIRDHEKEGKIPSPSFDAKTGRRYYTLAQINTLRDYFGTRPKRPNNSDPAIIAAINFKGGVTKTTSGNHIAQGFALKGYRVLFIDLDNQGSGTHCFGFMPDLDIDGNKTLLPLLLGKTDDLSNIIMKTYWDGLDLIPANLALYNAEFQLPVTRYLKKEAGENFEFYGLLRKGINNIKNNYDIIIIDCPPSMGMITTNAVYAANSLLIPIPPATLDFSSTVQFFGMMVDVLERLPPKEFNFIRLLISKFDNSDTSEILTKIIRQSFGEMTMTTAIPASEAIKKSGTDMRSIYETEVYAGSKKTFDRIKLAVEDMNDELEELIKKTWVNPNHILDEVISHV